MFDTVEATRFDRLMSVGRTKPMLLACERQDGNEVEVIAKFSTGCSIGGLIREAMTAMLARDIGLPVPEPFLVSISNEFIDSVQDVPTATNLRNGSRFGFGSCKLPNGFAPWIVPAGHMTSNLDTEALDILAFDCWTTNPDRRTSNHNLLTDGNGFAIIDHELALMTSLNLFWKEPWIPDALLGTQPPVDHVFYSHIRGRASYNLTRMNQSLALLTDGRIHEYAEAIPPEWSAHDDTAIRAEAYIIQLRDNATQAIHELTRALT